MALTEFFDLPTQALRALFDRISAGERHGLRVGTFGPGAVGKTDLKHANQGCCGGDAFDSGLLLLPESIAAHNDCTIHARAAEQESRRSLLPSTHSLQRWPLRLYDHGENALSIVLLDLEGQLLTGLK